MFRISGKVLPIGAAVAAVLGASAVSAAPQSMPMAGLRPGEYALRDLDTGTVEKICLNSGLRLLQLRHPRAECHHHILASGPDAVSVHYTCPGKGYGMTMVRGESAVLGLVDSQGIASGSPFAFRGELRRIGDC